MAFRWKELSNIACDLQGLIKDGEPDYNEAIYRTVINRLYYSLYHEVEDFLIRKYGYKVPQKSTHDKLLETIDKHQDKNINSKYYIPMVCMYLYRIQVDYYLSFNNFTHRRDPNQMFEIRDIKKQAAYAKNIAKSLFQDLNI